MTPNKYPSRQEAWQILEELSLLEFLSQIGQAHLVGSVALDLIVKPDIDLYLLVDKPNLMDTSNIVISYLFEQPKIREVRVTDWRKQGGIKIGVDHYPGELTFWDLDIWITNRKDTGGLAAVEEFSQLLTPQRREIILEIKRHFYDQDLLRDGISLKIYTAVLKDGIKNINEFLNWNQDE